MRLLYPRSSDAIGVAEVYDVDRPASPERPYVLVNMVASADGATVVSGLTRALGSPGDRHLFLYLRSLPDVILVGAETVRAEGYGPAKLKPELQDERRRRGQEALPRIAVVSRSLDMDWTSPFFTGGTRPILLAPEAAADDRLAAAREVADVITTPGPLVDFPVALGQLRADGASTVLCEGGPALNAQLLAAGLLDELCLSVSPSLVGAGGGSTIMGAAQLDHLVGLELMSVMEEEGMLFLRYLVNAAT